MTQERSKRRFDMAEREKINGILSSLDMIDESRKGYFTKNTVMVPTKEEIVGITANMQRLMFPEYFTKCDKSRECRVKLAEDIFSDLKRQITAAYSFYGEDHVVNTEDLAYEIIEEIPKIKEKLLKDVEAIYEGDPAARSPEEVILCYPGFFAICIYRIAHAFYERRIPYISRIMTEYAHEKTGIDIHAGAKIGEYFFIDHGTGIVIGETTTIGSHVKIYQGVTLGARSFELDNDGNPIKGIKRHPDIGNNCVIYANATILGGDTKIGDGSIIGGNVWITSSVAPGEKVYYKAK